MSETSNISELATAFSEFRGEMRSEIKHLGHDVKNINAKLDAYPTHRDLKAVENRVATLEDDKRWIVRSFWGVWISGLGVVIAGAAAYIKLAH